MNGLIIIGHPARPSYSHAMADRVAAAWRAAGMGVATQDLADLGFDPALTAAEARGAPSTDLAVKALIAALKQADYLAIIYPVMWGMPPAILKGWVDRVFAPGVAYGFAEGTKEAEGAPAIGLLHLKHALVLCTSNTAPQAADPLATLWRDTILGFCGVADVTYRSFSPLVPNTNAAREGWLNEAEDLAKAALL